MKSDLLSCGCRSPYWIHAEWAEVTDLGDPATASGAICLTHFNEWSARNISEFVITDDEILEGWKKLKSDLDPFAHFVNGALWAQKILNKRK